MEHNTLPVGNYEEVITLLRYKVEMYRAHFQITHRQYLTAMSLLSNPNFNNISMNLLVNTIKNGNTR